MARVKWQFDPAHSEILFKVKHMMVSNVSGQFKKFDIQLDTEGHDFTTAKASFTADINSLTTKVEMRDNHLKSDDFFDATNHPTLQFDSTRIIKKNDNEYDMEGNLTIRGITRPITFHVENIGMVVDPSGNHRAGFEITGKINRFDYGLKYNALIETGGVVVGDEVRITANVEVYHS
ncbi:MAG TPA: YceI family protein [Ginsengibacter sp.]|nr:YceI family protein [Chitinophagaceae bacterium]MCZ2395221.1 YceI family protein [Chitinophagales bacterium]HRN72196.1 YceI family protein [Ginsengibacter sp.]MCO5286759.1 YceI family protein [Chitinophagaceae bacterium]MCW5914664.1 YceI family protein [Chitinophagaceae bacterium]